MHHQGCSHIHLHGVTLVKVSSWEKPYWIYADDCRRVLTFHRSKNLLCFIVFVPSASQTLRSNMHGPARIYPWYQVYKETMLWVPQDELHRHLEKSRRYEPLHRESGFVDRINSWYQPMSQICRSLVIIDVCVMKKPRSNQRIYSILIVCEVVLDRFSHIFRQHSKRGQARSWMVIRGPRKHDENFKRVRLHVLCIFERWDSCEIFLKSLLRPDTGTTHCSFIPTGGATKQLSTTKMSSPRITTNDLKIAIETNLTGIVKAYLSSGGDPNANIWIPDKFQIDMASRSLVLLTLFPPFTFLPLAAFVSWRKEPGKNGNVQ
jgi:hypothetical protein